MLDEAHANTHFAEAMHGDLAEDFAAERHMAETRPRQLSADGQTGCGNDGPDGGCDALRVQSIEERPRALHQGRLVGRSSWALAALPVFRVSCQ